jgi:hypothetical protein
MLIDGDFAGFHEELQQQTKWWSLTVEFQQW